MKKLLTAIGILLVLVCSAQAKITAQQAEKVWHEVAQPTGLTGLPFGVKESITANAWVTAGKSVTVTTGLLDMLDTESELYGVLAHEAGHIKLKHTNNRVGRTVGKIIVVSIIGSLFGNIARSAADIGTDLATAGYSREQEIASDDFAVQLAFENGQDMTGLYYALKKISQVNKTEPSGFNSHPPDERRLLHIKNKIRQLKYKSEKLQPVGKTETKTENPATEETQKTKSAATEMTKIGNQKEEKETKK